MSRRDFTAIVPSFAETQATGFIGAGERNIRGKLWRVEWWNGEPAKFLRDGVPADVDIHKNRSACTLMMDSFELFKSTRYRRIS